MELISIMQLFLVSITISSATMIWGGSSTATCDL